MYYDGYLFDFDGTLVDSMGTFSQVVYRMLDEQGVAYGPDVVKTVTPLGYYGTAKYFHDMGMDMPVEEIDTMMRGYMLEQYCSHIVPKPHVARVLEELKARGARLGVLTASPHLLLDPCLKRNGLYELFDHVWSCDDFNTSKADPDIYPAAARKMGIPLERVLFLDDNIGACRTAVSAGMPVCGVFDETSREYEGEMRRICRCYIHDFDQLPALERG